GPVAGGAPRRAAAAPSRARPQLCELRVGLGGPTSAARLGAPPAPPVRSRMGRFAQASGKSPNLCPLLAPSLGSLVAEGVEAVLGVGAAQGYGSGDSFWAEVEGAELERGRRGQDLVVVGGVFQPCRLAGTV